MGVIEDTGMSDRDKMEMMIEFRVARRYTETLENAAA